MKKNEPIYQISHISVSNVKIFIWFKSYNLFAFCSSFFFTSKKSIFPQHVLFATDEVEFQEDGKFRLVCASRCSDEVLVGLDCN